jgi:hypothetical protein
MVPVGLGRLGFYNCRTVLGALARRASPGDDHDAQTFTDLDANAFAINEPVQLVHEYAGTASTVGLAVGSSGAWTGDMTMSVFVDSVTLGGLVVGSNAHDAKIVYPP